MGFDGLGAEEQLARDVLVRGAGGDEAGDHPLLVRELLGRRGRAAEALRGGAELLSRLDPRALAAQAPAEAQPRARRLERRRGALVPAQGLLEVRPVLVGEPAGTAPAAAAPPRSRGRPRVVPLSLGSSSSSPKWAGKDDVLYSIDYQRGIDILRWKGASTTCRAAATRSGRSPGPTASRRSPQEIERGCRFLRSPF